MDSLDLSLIVMMVIGALVTFAPIFIMLIGMKYNNREEMITVPTFMIKGYQIY